MLALSGLWVLALALVSPWIEAALNDDFAYAVMVERFLESGEIRPTSWTFIPAVSNVWLGALFQTAFGKTQMALHLSSMVMGWAAMLGVYGISRLLGGSVWLSSLAAFAYGLQPAHLNLACTFMTDVSFSAFFVLGVLGAVLFFRGHRWGLLLGLAGGVLAALSRQPGGMLLVAGGAAFALSKLRNPRHLIWIGLAGAALVGLLVWLIDSGVADGRIQVLTIIPFLLQSISFWSLAVGLVPVVLTTLGFVAAPVVASVLPVRDGRSMRRILWIAGTLGALLWATLFRKAEMPPGFLGSILSKLGAGPISMHGATLRQEMPVGLRFGLTMLATLAICVALVALAGWLWRRGYARLVDDSALTCVLLSGCFYLAPMLIAAPMDRYLLPVTAMFACVLVAAAERPPTTAQTLVGITGAVLVGTFSLLATRDYLDHQHSRLALVEVALSEYGAPAEQIEGGFEFDGAENYERITESARQWIRDNDPEDEAAVAHRALTERIEFMADPNRWPLDDRFVVSLSPAIEGYEQVEARSRTRTLWPEPETLYLHAKR